MSVGVVLWFASWVAISCAFVTLVANGARAQIRDDRIDELGADEWDSLCGEPDCQRGTLVVYDTPIPCPECVRRGIVSGTTGEVLG